MTSLQVVKKEFMKQTVNKCRYFKIILSAQFVNLLLTHTARLAQGFIATNCSEFIGKDEWPPNSPDLSPLDYHVWGAMLERYKTFHPKPKNIDELKSLAANMESAAAGLNQQGHT